MYFDLPNIELSGPVRQTAKGQVAVLDLLKALDLENPEQHLHELTQEFPEYVRGLTLEAIEGGEPTPVLPLSGILKLMMVLETPKARVARRWMASTLGRVLEGDVGLAAEIAERNPDPEARRWLVSRMDNQEGRKSFMSKVLEHGGEGRVFGQVSSISNRSVLGMNSAAFRAYRGVQNTRDGMTRAELARMTYLESLSGAALDAGRARGNGRILDIHKKVADWERRLWRHALGHPQEPLDLSDVDLSPDTSVLPLERSAPVRTKSRALAQASD